MVSLVFAYLTLGLLAVVGIAINLCSGIVAPANEYSWWARLNGVPRKMQEFREKAIRYYELQENAFFSCNSESSLENYSIEFIDINESIKNKNGLSISLDEIEIASKTSGQAPYNFHLLKNNGETTFKYSFPESAYRYLEQQRLSMAHS